MSPEQETNVFDCLIIIVIIIIFYAIVTCIRLILNYFAKEMNLLLQHFLT